MIAGHTKFSCDRYFDLIKKRYIRSKIDTIAGVSRVVLESSQGHNIPQLMKNSDGEHIVNCYDWVGYFESLAFRSIQKILKYHMFSCDIHPGAIFVK